MTVPNCYLLSSHDDYSVVAMLPEDVAVLTHIRDPVDRFLSAYEFAIEVAARAVTTKKKPANFKKNPDKISTDDVWPWSYLVPWFAQDMMQRVRGALSGGNMMQRVRGELSGGFLSLLPWLTSVPPLAQCTG